MKAAVFLKLSAPLLISGATAFTYSGTNKIEFPSHLEKTKVAQLKENDSLCYYQCYCAINSIPPKYILRDSVEKFKSGIITVTEKFILKRSGNGYTVRFYTSTLTDYPNKKFAYLKLKEKDYWGFTLKKDTSLSHQSVLKLAALELKLRSLTEYNFKVENDNYPQVIINGRKISEQKMVEGNYLIRDFLPELN